jgi:HD-GYP domain-containing protein (c-di-GMP phosphodiesterase class II)
LPVVFVVDQNGKAVAHPDAAVAYAERSMTDLRVVEEWLESGSQVQSALAPFNLERDGKSVAMLGSYATAELDQNSLLGVIAIQDEGAALASVRDMRNQIFFVSLLAATLALLCGFYFARKLSRPVGELAAGATRIAGGDFSRRVQVVGPTELCDLGSSFNQMSDHIERYIQDLQRSAQENRELFLGTVKALAAAIDGKDPYTRGHSERVSRFSVATAEGLGLDEDAIEKIRVSALLHDVGKISIDDNILKKPAALSDEEYAIMKTHPQKGYKIMSQIPAIKDFLPGMYMHHEMVNGGGYPQGLKGDEIPMQARVVAVADTFDAMTTDRPYAQGLDLETALTRLKSFVGTRYDARVVAAFVAACEEGKIRPGVTRLRRNQNDYTSKTVPFPIAPAADSVLAVS